jgi:hypothetical protein
MTISLKLEQTYVFLCEAVKENMRKAMTTREYAGINADPSFIA